EDGHPVRRPAADEPGDGEAQPRQEQPAAGRGRRGGRVPLHRLRAGQERAVEVRRARAPASESGYGHTTPPPSPI
ncbi:hypothetical protein KEM52_005201, partial [Ascosphaera acerosa]